jgi:hypothetical protein
VPLLTYTIRGGLYLVAGLLLSGCVTERQIASNPTEIRKYTLRETHGVFQVAGCVYHPGKFSLKPGQTIKLSEALQMAGGSINGNYFASERSANLRDIRVKRKQNDTIIEFKLDIYPGENGGNFIIQPGDSIFVPELI